MFPVLLHYSYIDCSALAYSLAEADYESNYVTRDK
jgi:hypothetical protein